MSFENDANEAITQFYAGNYKESLALNLKAIIYAKSPKVKLPASVKAQLHANQGFTYLAMNDYQSALIQFKLSNSFEHNDENDWSQFICHANLKNWDAAKKFHHARYGETRTAPTRVRFPKLPIPLIKNFNQLKDSTILVLNEQGLGDEILFFSGIKKLASVCKVIHLQVYDDTFLLFIQQLPSNVTIFRSREISAELINLFDAYSTSGDMFIYSMELEGEMGYEEPLVFPTTTEPTGRGFCWQANVASPNSALRSIDIEYLEEWYKLEDGLNQSLQLNVDCPDWLTQLPQVDSLYDTARLMANLKDVVTVDTSIAHLAGAMHIPTTLIINKHHDWRWKQLKANGYSKFYPTVKVVHNHSLTLSLD